MCVRKTLRHRTLLYNKAGRTKFLPPSIFFYFPLFNFPCHQRHKTTRLNQPLFFLLFLPTDFSPSRRLFVSQSIVLTGLVNWFASALRVCVCVNRWENSGEGVFLFFSWHIRPTTDSTPIFFKRGFFRFGGKPFFLTLHHLHKKTTTGNWNNYTGGHDWGKVSKPICTRVKGGPPKHKPAEFIGAQRRKKKNPWVFFFLWCTPPKHSKVPFFSSSSSPPQDLLLSTSRPIKRRRYPPRVSRFFFSSSSSFLWPLSIFFFFYHHHHSSSSSPRQTMQPRKKNIIITNENPDRLVLYLQRGGGNDPASFGTFFPVRQCMREREIFVWVVGMLKANGTIVKIREKYIDPTGVS